MDGRFFAVRLSIVELVRVANKEIVPPATASVRLASSVAVVRLRGPIPRSVVVGFSLEPFQLQPQYRRRRTNGRCCRLFSPPTHHKYCTAMTSIAPSSIALAEAKEWADVASFMDDVLAGQVDQYTHLESAVQQCNSLINSISNQTDALHARSEEITNSITAEIEKENVALQNESNELATQIRAVQKLEEEAATLTKTNAEIIAKKRASEQNIPIYKAEAAEQIGKLDEIEMEHVKRIPKIKNQLSMFAELTNVKWDYNQKDVLAGEISLPSKFVHRKFAIDKEKLSKYEVTEQLWSIIEG